MDEQIISQDGYNKLVEELNFLQTTKRRDIAERIERAKEMGDLSENAEYSEAKEAQSFNDGRINEVTNLLKNLRVVANAASGIVSMGAHVTVKVNGEKRDYTMVSFNEADPTVGKISNESPLGIALLGKAKGDRVVVKTPKGETEYQIVAVE